MGLMINGAPDDEDDSEARTILARLPTRQTVEATRTMVHEEFCHWFSVDICGPEKNYTGAAAAIWNWWDARRSS
jgi:hypothetical protein